MNEKSEELLRLESSQFDNQEERIMLRWFGHVERKDDNDWVRRCMTWETEGIRQMDIRKTWWVCYIDGMESLGLSQKDALFRNKYRSCNQGGNRLTKVHLEKWPLKWSVCVCILCYE